MLTKLAGVFVQTAPSSPFRHGGISRGPRRRRRRGRRCSGRAGAPSSTPTVLLQSIPEPLGFVAIDVDFYSSTVDCLRLLTRPDVARLHRVAFYFDDARMHWNHRYAGELLAARMLPDAPGTRGF